MAKDKISECIIDAFSAITCPEDLVDPGLEGIDRENALSFRCLPWRDVDLRRHDGELGWATSFFSPAALRFFMPGIMLSSVRYQLDESDAVMRIIWSLSGNHEVGLDRTKWSEYFSSRWGAFSLGQYAAIRNWLYWVRERREKTFKKSKYPMELARLEDIDAAIATIEWLKDRCERRERPAD